MLAVTAFLLALTDSNFQQAGVQQACLWQSNPVCMHTPVRGLHQYLCSYYAALGHSKAERNVVSKTVSLVIKASLPHCACGRQLFEARRQQRAALTACGQHINLTATSTAGYVPWQAPRIYCNLEHARVCLLQLQKVQCVQHVWTAS